MNKLKTKNETFLNQRYQLMHSADGCADDRVSRWQAMDLKSDRNVNLEMATMSEEAQYRFKIDLEKLCQIDCDQILQPVDFGIDGDIAFVVSKENEAVSLSEFDINRINTVQKLTCAIQILEAVSAIHQQGLIHRNIQASSVFLTERGALLGGVGINRYISLSDQGLKQALDFSTYVSPELSGALVHDIGPASDLYSVGALLFQLFAGQPPFIAVSVNDMLFQHLTDEPPIELLPQAVCPAIRDILTVLLRKEPSERYQSADSVLYDFRELKKLLETDQSTEDFVICRNEIKPEVGDPAFVGRKKELDLLSDTLAGIKNNAHQHALISCPSGIGKSRLVIEFIRQASKQNVTVLSGRGSNEAGRVPMGPLLEVINQLSERLAGDPGRAKQLGEQLSDVANEIAAVCPDFARLLNFKNVRELGGPEEFGQNRVENAIAKLLAAVGSNNFPYLIWIDDCQWLDDQTHKILGLVRAFEPKQLLMLYTMRSECQQTYDKFVLQVEPETCIELGPLTEEEVVLLQESMTGPLPKAAGKTVVKLAEGSPFMASAVVRGMFESGAIKTDSTGWKIVKEAFAEIQTADDAAQVLLQRLQQLPSESLRLLSVAAMIGKEFDVQCVSEISNVSDVDSMLEVARQNRLVWAKPNGTISFVHDKIREALIELIQPQNKLKYHLRLAEYLEANRNEQVFDIAFHYHRAEKPKQALPFAINAATLARERFSLELAEEQLDIAITGLNDTTPRAKFNVYSLLADITMVSGRYSESEKWLNEAGGYASEAKEKVNVICKQGELEFKRGNKKRAVEFYEKALKDLGFKTPRFVIPSVVAEVCKQALHSIAPRHFVGTKGKDASVADRFAWQLHSKLAHGYWYTRDRFQTFWAHLRGLNLAEKYEPTPELAQAYSEHAPAMSLLPWHSRGIQYADRSLELRSEFGDVWGQGQSRNFKSILLYSASDFDACIEQARRANTILERTGDYWEVHIARYQLAAALYRKGDLQAATREAREIYHSALELGDYQATANIIDVWVRANLNRIPSEIIEREANRVLDDHQTKCQVLLAQGVSLIGAGQHSEAANKFREAINVSTQSGVLNAYMTPNFPWLATALRLKFNERTIRSSVTQKNLMREMLLAAKKAVKVGRSYKNELPHALRELGAVQTLAGNLEQSKKALLESIKVAQSQGACYEQAKSELLLKQIADESGWDDVAINDDPSLRLKSIELPVSGDQSATTLSIVDRFDSLLEAGRQISSSNSREEIGDACVGSVNRLLRSQRSMLIDPLLDAQDVQDKVDMQLVQQAISERKAIISSYETLSNSKTHRCEGSYLTCPIISNGEVTSVLYAGNDAVCGLFGENEIRIAEFLTTTAGAAFEKADSFRELEEMNESLEKRVAQRTEVIRARSDELEATAIELRLTQKSLEEARDVAQYASDAKSEFLARMSHEIRTPIAAINGFSELMLRGVIGPDQQKEKLETILGNGRHLLRLINNLLDLSKVEADQMDTELLHFNPSLIVNEVIQSLRFQAEEKGLNLQTQIKGEIPRLIQSDPTRFRQIVTNLVGNAIKFTSKGSVLVTLGFENSSHPSPEAKLVVEVIDTGIGMTDEQSEKVFQPFVQADTSTTRKYGGTGLGLSISKKLAEELGGNLRVQSSLGKGSSFQLRIATGQVDQTDTINEITKKELDSCYQFGEWDSTNLETRSVLVVDDAETNRNLLTLVLEDCGAIVSTCVNGQEAVDEFLAGRDYDLVLMDMQMPVLDGYSATKKIRKLEPNVPIIALTANSMINDDKKCFAAGCSDYLPKPIDTELLFQKISFHISRTMRRGQYSDQAATPTSPKTKPMGNDCHQSDREFDAPVPRRRRIEDLDRMLADLAEQFIEKLESRLPQCKEDLANEDFANLATIGHWLKGTAGTVGLHDLSELGAQLDLAGRKCQLDVATSVIEAIELRVKQSDGSGN